MNNNTKTKSCKVEGCGKKHEARGYCKTHYNYWLKHGTPVCVPEPTRLCEVEDCNKKHVALGYCKRHYTNFKRHGRPIVYPDKCTYEGCEGDYYAKGFCVKHYARWKAHGDPSKVISRKIVGKCKVKDCENEIYCQGYCVTHYQRYLKHGDPLKTMVNMDHTGKCHIEGCDENFFAKNMCERHYNRSYGKRYKRSSRGKEVSRMYCQRRRARKNKSPINDFTNKQWGECLTYFNNKCAYCGEKESTLNQEHNIPISKGGSHTKTNIIPSCGYCNSSKGARTIHEWYKAFEHYDKKREEKILRYLGYKVKKNKIQLQLF